MLTAIWRAPAAPHRPRGVLHAAVGMMDEAVGRRIARGNRPVQRLDRQARLEMIGERPADHFAREGVEDDRQIDEVLGQPDIGDVGDPDLIEAARSKPARQVWRNGPTGPRSTDSRQANFSFSALSRPQERSTFVDPDQFSYTGFGSLQELLRSDQRRNVSVEAPWHFSPTRNVGLEIVDFFCYLIVKFIFSEEIQWKVPTPNRLIEFGLSAEIVAAYVSHNSVPSGDLAALISSVHAALTKLGQTLLLPRLKAGPRCAY